MHYWIHKKSWKSRSLQRERCGTHESWFKGVLGDYCLQPPFELKEVLWRILQTVPQSLKQAYVYWKREINLFSWTFWCHNPSEINFCFTRNPGNSFFHKHQKKFKLYDRSLQQCGRKPLHQIHRSRNNLRSWARNLWELERKDRISYTVILQISLWFRGNWFCPHEELYFIHAWTVKLLRRFQYSEEILFRW